MTNTQVVAVDALAALGHPTRRALFEAIAAHPAAVGELARGRPVSRSAVSQHLRVLKDTGLVTDEAVGTRRIYRLDPRGVAAMRDWLDAQWGAAITAFQQAADARTERESLP